MIKPTIHLNGTSVGALMDLYREAYSKIGDAIDAVTAAGPNGRDYYPQGDTCLAEAAAEHARRVRALQHVRDQMLELYDHCSQWADD